MTLARGLRKISARLIRQFGTPATLRRIVSTIDPVAGTTEDAETDFSGHCVIERFADHLVDGTVVQRGDRKLTFAAAALGAEPRPVTTEDDVTTTWRVIVGGESFQVHRAEPAYAQDAVVLWQVHGRK